MADELDRDGQLEILKKRLLDGGMSRRKVLKVAAAAAGTAAAGVAVVLPEAASAAPAPGRAPAPAADQAGEEQVFYEDQRYQDPTSFDFNANLYCNAEPEVFAGLLQFDENLNAVPDWADRFEVNADATVFTFHLRKDNKGWTDGHPVTARDFAYSFARQLDPATKAAYAGFLFDIKHAEAFNTGKPVANPSDPLNGKVPTAADLGIKVIDDWTLELTMEGPRAYFAQVVAYQAAFPAPKWQVDKYGDKWALVGDVPLVSNGPFKVDSWVHNQKIVMSKHDGYWDAENVKLTKVIEPIFPAANTVLLYEKGSGDQRLDWTTLSAGDYKRYQADPELKKQIQPYVYPGIWMLLPQATVKPFDNLKVRQAISHAVDRARLGTVTNGLETPAYCMVPPGVFGYLDDPALQKIQDFDPKKAIDALKGTEYEGGKNWPEVTMYMRADEENYNADIMANDLVDQLKKNIGLDVKIQPIPQSNFVEQLYQNKWPLVFIRWWYDYPDPNNGYFVMFYSRKSSGKRQAWSNKDFDDLCLKGAAEPDQQKRLDIYKQAEMVIQNDVGYIPLVYRTDPNVFKPWVKGVPVNKQGYAVGEGNIYVGMLRRVFVQGRPKS